MTEEEMRTRAKQFALRVIYLVGALPRNILGKAIGAQLIRSGTSVGANYRAACKARSRAEVIARLGTVEEEADESAYWMELIRDEGGAGEPVAQGSHRTHCHHGRLAQVGIEPPLRL